MGFKWDAESATALGNLIEPAHFSNMCQSAHSHSIHLSIDSAKDGQTDSYVWSYMCTQIRIHIHNVYKQTLEVANSSKNSTSGDLTPNLYNIIYR